MSVLCYGSTHIYRVGSTRCDCGAQANNPPVFNAPNPHHPRYVAPVAGPEIEPHRKALARRSGASHISADGLTAYKWLFGKVYKADWLQDAFGVWWATGEEVMPSGAVEV